MSLVLIQIHAQFTNTPAHQQVCFNMMMMILLISAELANSGSRCLGVLIDSSEFEDNTQKTGSHSPNCIRLNDIYWQKMIIE